MKKKKIFINFVSLITILSFVLNLNFYRVKTYANDQGLMADINMDNLNENLFFENNVFKIYASDGKLIYSEKNNETDSIYKNIFIMNDADNSSKIIVSKKTNDTSGLLSYSVYEYKNGIVNKLETISNIYKGLIQVINNTLIQTSPIYNSSDSNAEPSSLEKKYFILKSGKLSLEKSEVTANKKSIIKSGTYYKNPSRDEIEKIIKHVAYEKGIPSVILEAIAWTESNGTDPDNNNTANWRQFSGGSPLIGFDGVGIGIMQVTSYDPLDTDYVNRLKYDIEFNISEGAKILLNKWARGFSAGTDKIPQVGNGQPTLLENWYFTIWAYNGYTITNNPVNNTTPYQGKVITFVNNTFNTPMIDLYQYKSDFFQKDILPSAAAFPAVTGAHSGDVKQKAAEIRYVVASGGPDSLSIKNDTWTTIDYFNQGDIVEILNGPIYYNGFFRYYVKGISDGISKEGWVAGNYIRPAGDVNCDETVNVFDLAKTSKQIAGTSSYEYLKCDANMDGYVDLKDITLAAENYNIKLYTNDIN